MELQILDQELDTIDVIDEFDSLIWTERYNKCGDFELYAPVSAKLLGIATAGNYARYSGSKDLMIIENHELRTDHDSGIKMLVAGSSLASILKRRLIYGTEILLGDLDTNIHRLFDNNVISPEDPNRRIERFRYIASQDPVVKAADIASQHTYDNLYEVIEKRCNETDIGFKVEVTDDDLFNFSLYAGVDRSYDQDENAFVVFSPGFDNLLNSEYRFDMRSYANTAVVGGEGEGSERIFIHLGDDRSMDRYELFVDARDISSKPGNETLTPEQYRDQLAKRGSEKLIERKTLETFEGEVDATTMFKYGTDFGLGDIVQIENEYNMVGRSRVSEIIFSHTKDKVTTMPKFETI